MVSSRLNILVSAHELNPYGGSECAEGWNVVTRLANYHNITVLYASGSQFEPFSYEKGINEYFRIHEKTENLTFIAIPQTRITSLLSSVNRKISGNKSSIGNPFLYFLGYSLWEKKAYSVAKNLCKKTKFDIVHHLTSISFREPGYLWKLDIPFVWGPTGGLSTIPFQYHKFIGYKAYTKEIIRNSINYLQFFYNINIAKALKTSALIYAFSKEDELMFSKRKVDQTKILLDAASFLSTNENKIITPGAIPVKVIWCGELIQRKALEIIFYAIKSEPELMEKISVKIVGGGPREDYYKSLAQTLEINKCIEFVGKVDRKMVFEIMNKSDILIHSSYREGTTHVIPEALSHGLPVICHDINGMSIAVDDRCGIKVPLISPEKSIEGFKEAMMKLVNNPDLLLRLKNGAISRSNELSWDKMAETIAQDYTAIYAKNTQA
jgi:glycosyltransferase involved in cell wall biosynthesis